MQYATTADGMSIAFCILEEGVPFVHVPNFPFSHIELGRQ